MFDTRIKVQLQLVLQTHHIIHSETSQSLSPPQQPCYMLQHLTTSSTDHTTPHTSSVS